MAEQQQEEVEATAPGGFKVRVRGYDIIVVIATVIMTMVAYMVYEHKIEAHASSSNIANAMRDLASAQREMACIISLPQERREQEFISPNGFCKRITFAR